MKSLADAIESVRKYLTSFAADTLDDGLTVLGEPEYLLLKACEVTETERTFGSHALPVEFKSRSGSDYVVQRMVAFQLDDCRYLVIAEVKLGSSHDSHTVMYFYDASIERVYKFRAVDAGRLEQWLADPASATIWTRS